MSAEITTREIYDEVRKISSKLDQLVTRSADLEQQGEDHEQRLRALERHRWSVAGAVSVVAILAGGVVSLIVSLVTGA